MTGSHWTPLPINILWKGVLLLCDWRKKKTKRICVVVLAFAAIQPALCAMAHHRLCLLLVVVAANQTASLLTSHFLLVVFSSWLEMFKIVVTYFGRSRCSTVAVLERRVSDFFYWHAASRLLQHGCHKIGSLPGTFLAWRSWFGYIVGSIRAWELGSRVRSFLMYHSLREWWNSWKEKLPGQKLKLSFRFQVEEVHVASHQHTAAGVGLLHRALPLPIREGAALYTILLFVHALTPVLSPM